MAKIEIDNIKMWESYRKQLELHACYEEMLVFDDALKDLGLEWNGKEIVSVELDQDVQEENTSYKIKQKFKAGDIVVSGKNLIYEIESVDKEGYKIKNRPGVFIPFELQDKWVLYSVAENIIRERIISEIDVDTLLKEAERQKVYPMVTYKMGIIATINAIKKGGNK